MRDEMEEEEAVAARLRVMLRIGHKNSNTATIASRILHLLESHCHSPSHLHQIQAQLILHNLYPNTTLASRFISACHSLGSLRSAVLLYTVGLPRPPHTFVCNHLLRAFSRSLSLHHYSFSVYSHMHNNGVPFNNYTFPFILKSLSDLKRLEQGECVHAHVVKLGHLYDIYVGNSLLNLYASCGDMLLCKHVFDEMPLRDVVSWTVMITGYRGSGKFADALAAFEEMQNAGVEPNQVTMVNMLAACSSVGALNLGLWIDEFIKKRGWKLDVVLGTALIDMYGKCGRIGEGVNVFKRMEEKEVFTWSALIKGFALAKSGEEAVWWLSKMEEEGFKPNEVTLLAVLCACVHSGLVATGQEIFCSLLNNKYGFPPNVKHYACMVDVLSRDGRLEDALKIITEMPFGATKSIWGAFLSGCRTHGNLELSEFAAWKLVELEPDNGAYYAILSSLYAEMRRWDDVERIRGLMKERDLRKDSGLSSLQLEHFDDVPKSKWLAVTQSRLHSDAQEEKLQQCSQPS